MEKNKSFIDNVVNYYDQSMGIDKRQEAIIRFALALLSNTILSILFAVIIAIYFKQVYILLIVLVTNSSLKMFAGGAHSRHSINCAIIGAVITNLIAYSSKFIIQLPYNIVVLFIIIASLFSLYIFYKYSPMTAENKPINEENKKARLRMISIVILLVWITYCIFNVYLGRITQFSMAPALTITWQSFSMTPMMYKIIKWIDDLTY